MLSRRRDGTSSPTSRQYSYCPSTPCTIPCPGHDRPAARAAHQAGRRPLERPGAPARRARPWAPTARRRRPPRTAAGGSGVEASRPRSPLVRPRSVPAPRRPAPRRPRALRGRCRPPRRQVIARTRRAAGGGGGRRAQDGARRHLQPFLLRLQLPVHGQREAEEAARLPAPADHVLRVQVEGAGQPRQQGQVEEERGRHLLQPAREPAAERRRRRSLRAAPDPAPPRPPRRGQPGPPSGARAERPAPPQRGRRKMSVGCGAPPCGEPGPPRPSPAAVRFERRKTCGRAGLPRARNPGAGCRSGSSRRRCG